MAKRKTAARGKAARKTARKAKATPKKAVKAAKTGTARKAAKRAAKKPAKRAAPTKAARRAASTKAAKRAAPKKTAKRAAPRKAVKKAARKPPAKAASKAPARAAAKPAKAAPQPAARPKRATRPAPIRGAIPSSLGMNGGSSAARSGREELLQHIKERTETSPAITAGDVDADWQLAYSSGDEAPGGDNPTPDQDVVDEIGEALGVNYEDGEELKGAAKIEDRDKHRWELDPASKDDFDEE